MSNDLLPALLFSGAIGGGWKYFDKRIVQGVTISQGRVNDWFFIMHKTIFLKKGIPCIATIWFFLCIAPGDCFLLRCAEKYLPPCAEEELVIASYTAADSFIPAGDQHCAHCCVLCAHNLVLGLLQNSSLFLHSPSSRFTTPYCNHPTGIFPFVIYHPPRLAA